MKLLTVKVVVLDTFFFVTLFKKGDMKKERYKTHKKLYWRLFTCIPKRIKRV
jgi:deoxyadenosine/deoxycytidine kinase